jgi:hypothetical protein
MRVRIHAAKLTLNVPNNLCTYVYSGYLYTGELLKKNYIILVY